MIGIQYIKFGLITLAIFGAILLLTNCSDAETNEVDYDREWVEGSWKIQSALRNGNPTTTLDGSEFVFENEVFSTNFTGTLQSGTYTLSADTIYTGVKIPEIFIVEEIDSQIMMLRTLISGHSFRLRLDKEEKESNLEID